MSIIIIIIIGIIVTALGIAGYLEKLFGLKIQKAVYITLFIIFIIVSVFSIWRQIISEKQINELELRTNTIQSMQLHISIDAKTPTQQLTEKETSVGWSSAVALFTTDNTRYRFVTDYQYSVQQVSENTSRLSLIYEPEDQIQLYGKPIDFLKNMDFFACDYSSFFQSVGFDPGSTGNSVNIIVFINGIDVVVIHVNVLSGILQGGPANMNISKDFANISNTYSDRIRIKNT